MSPSNAMDRMATPSAPYPPSYDPDEHYARQLYQEEQDERMARDLQQQMRREEELQQMCAREQRDAVVAQDLEQQLRDEALARQLAMAEEQALAQRQQQARAQTPSRSRRWCTAVVPFLIGVAGSVALYFVLSNSNNGGQGSIAGIDIPFLRDTDPFDGLTPSEVPRWRTNGRTGLKMTILNALQDDWQETFAQVLQDWDNGTPDVLQLQVSQVTPDPTCEPIIGQSKVCNGDYGATDWKGINIVVMQMGYIEASTSRVNEYYLARADPAQRRYTLCHEMGHSFGLPHSDEDFFNRDLGNCMDYTQNPEVNLRPDESNFLFLQELYGVLPNRTRTLEDTLVNRRNLRSPSQASVLPETVREAMKKADAILTDAPTRRLQQKGQFYTMELQDGWRLLIHKVV